MTLAEYREVLRGLVGRGRSSASRAYPDADLNRALNAAQALVLLELDHDFFKKTATARDATAAAITAPADLLGSYTLRLVVSSTDYRDLLLANAEEWDRTHPNWRNETAQYPTHYVPTLNSDGTESFLLWPTLTATIPSGLVERYIPTPADMSLDADTSKVANFFPHRQAYLLPYGAMQYLPNLEAGASDDLAAKFRALFQEQIRGCRRDLERRYIQNGSYGL